MIQLVAFDLDGTLLDEKQHITPRVLDAVAAAQDQGVYITLATGRVYPIAVPFAQRLHINIPLICSQGCWIQGVNDPEPRYRAVLPADATQKALELAERENWHTVFYAGMDIFIQELLYPYKFYTSLLANKLDIEENWEKVLKQNPQADKLLFILPEEEVPGMIQQLRAHLDGRATVMQSHKQLVEVVPTEDNKGTGLAWLADYLGIPQEAVMACGDQENDIEMVRWAGMGVAMGNAIPAVKDVADWIAPYQEDDGAAVAVERFVLLKDFELMLT